MEKTNKKIIAIALVLSVITSVLVYVYITRGTKTASPEIEYRVVYVAARTIPARAAIMGEDVKQVKIAKELLNANAMTDLKEIVGKRTKESIIEGEQIVRERLADKKNVSLSYNIPEGTRAVSMNVNEQIDVAGLLRPGDFVDIIACFEKEEESDGTNKKIFQRVTDTILQNVQVLALGQDVDLSSDKLKNLPATVTLAIKKEDVEKFVFASEYGTLRLALRPLDDKSEQQSQGVIRDDIAGSRGVYSKAAQ
ncbi:MAG: Flp pilus assembly protein CpaB [Bacillota bacterium]|nr:Flp pilus assembly protein CpaB [Bacillota bacterium]